MMGKRAFDVVFATLGLLLTSPLLILIAIAIKLTSRGPVFFRQERIGRGFQPFRICKFRTMFDGASGSLITKRGDERVTAFGRLLRRSKLDELPQLWNVVKGEMSLVGPRPEVNVYVERFRADYEEILTVRPGITDEASLAFRNEGALLDQATDPELEYLTNILPRKIGLAKHYVKTHTMLGDLKIILRTIFHV